MPVIIRTIVYEGTEAQLAAQMGRSVPDGIYPHWASFVTIKTLLNTNGISIGTFKKNLLTFNHFTQVNMERCSRWHALTSWSLSDWATAVTGELGELCNIIKKLNRVRDGMQQNALKNQENAKTVLYDQAKMEIGDTAVLS